MLFILMCVISKAYYLDDEKDRIHLKESVLAKLVKL